MFHSIFESPLGPLTLVGDTNGLLAIWWPEDSRRGEIGPRQDDQPLMVRTREQLGEYFAGRRTEFDLPLAATGTDFQESAWAALREIPYGQTRTYAQQAQRLGDARKARAVGTANSRNPLSIVVPCHRVVLTSGAAGGFAGGTSCKQWLLDFERGYLTR